MNYNVNCALITTIVCLYSCGDVSHTTEITSDTASPSIYQYDSLQNVANHPDTVESTYLISDLKITSDENFNDYISFFIKNNDKEDITNILIEKAFYPIKNKKSDLLNKKVSIKENDSIKIQIKYDCDQLSIKRIRYKSGRTINYYSTKVFDKNVIHYKL